MVGFVFSDGYSGVHCEKTPDFCQVNECQNGASCINGMDNYTCSCAYGFKGQLCEAKAGTSVSMLIAGFVIILL